MRKLTGRVPTVISLLALFFALGGTAIAAKHYLITSTHQIKPSVLKALKGKTGKTGPAGKAGAAGKPGDVGKTGETGKTGEPGKNGAVAGYSAAATKELELTEQGKLVEVPGLSVLLPAGSYIANASVQLSAHSSTASKYVNAECKLLYKPSTGTPVAVRRSWASATAVNQSEDLTTAVLAFEAPVTSDGTGKLEVACADAGLDASVTLEVVTGSLVAVQTSENK